jgi:hypothetical protein
MKAQRRHFSRVPITADARLRHDGHTTPCTVLDVSLKGALVAFPDALVAAGSACELVLRLADDATVKMRGHVAHAEDDHLGIACDGIDLDSMIHLRRMIELNLGDPALLERELAAMISD